MSQIIFDETKISQMSLVANFAIKGKQIMFLYYSRTDTCHVLIDMQFVGYFKGDNTFKDPNQIIIKQIELPKKSIYSFEKEFIPMYVSVVTQSLLEGMFNK